jgi:hypothetical protein
MNELGKEVIIVDAMLGALVGIALLVFGFSVGFMIAPQAGTDGYADERDSEQKMPSIVVINNTVAANNTALLAEISKLQSSLDEDDTWKATAIAMAEDEYTNRHLYDALKDLNVTDIDDKSDIDRFVVKDVDTNDLDADKKDAEIIEEVRIYYENHVGDDVRFTLEVTTTIEDGEVTDTEYDLA